MTKISQNPVVYPGAAAQSRCLWTGFRAVDATNNFGLSPNALNTSGANTYQFVRGNRVGRVDAGAIATFVTRGIHPFNPMRAGMVIAPDRMMHYRYACEFGCDNVGGYPDVGGAKLLGYNVGGVDTPVAAAPIWKSERPTVAMSGGYHLNIDSVVMTLPSNGGPRGYGYGHHSCVQRRLRQGPSYSPGGRSRPHGFGNLARLLCG